MTRNRSKYNNQLYFNNGGLILVKKKTHLIDSLLCIKETKRALTRNIMFTTISQDTIFQNQPEISLSQIFISLSLTFISFVCKSHKRFYTADITISNNQNEIIFISFMFKIKFNNHFI